jgi:dodecin
MAGGVVLRQIADVCYAAGVAVARVTEIRASSREGFREAVEEGLARATRTLRGITGLEVLDKRVKVERGQIVEYRVDMKIIFVLE